jgi:MFS family permease
MADTAPETKYGAAMGLYSFALGFGFFIAEFSGLLIIAAYAYSLPPDKVKDAVNASLTGLFYFALVLIAVAVLLMLRFFVLGRKKEQAAKEAVQELGGSPELVGSRTDPNPAAQASDPSPIEED